MAENILQPPTPTMDTRWEFAGWQQRYIDPNEGPSGWQCCSPRDALLLIRRSDYELRATYAFKTE